jgi:hypothetical protein
MIESRRMRWAAHTAGMGRRGMHMAFWLENQRPLGKLRQRWEDNIKMDPKET